MSPRTVALVMSAVPPISQIQSRIASILGRFDPAARAALDTTSSPQLMAEFTAPTPTGFDPFGATYQAAVAASQSQRLADLAGLSTATYNSSYAVAPSWAGTQAVSADMFAMNPNPGSSVGRIGGYGPMPVPEDLAAYGNGQIPAGVLEPIGQGGHRLWGPAAASWRSLVDAAAADGIDLRITDSYRSYDQQVDLVRRKGLYSEGGYGAVPGTSNHGWGLAVDADVTNERTLSWMRANAYRFGFVEAVPREPWHWEFRPHQA